MNRWLAIGYAGNIVLILASILIAREGVPGIGRDAAMATSQALLVLLLPAGIITLRGAVRSHGKLRRVLGYSIFGLDLVLSFGGLLAGALILFAGARVVA